MAAGAVFETSNEKAVSGALALVMHGLFFAMLVFSVNWQKKEPVAMVAELWSSLPSPQADVPPPPPPAPPKVEPEPPKPAPKVEAKPVPKVEPKPQPKAEIDLRDKKEKALKAKEQEVAEKKKQQEQALLEKKKREEQEKQAREAADTRRRQQEQADALKKQAQEAGAAQAREIDKYKQAIAARIKRFIVEPPNLQGNPEVEFEVIQLPGGEILGVKTRKASGQSPWDAAVERAILRAQPLPQPPDPALFKEVRELHLKFRPKD
jgi:colicin import membrane protein